MKKITKFMKLLMVFVMIFSQLSTVTAVLADEMSDNELETLEENLNIAEDEIIEENENASEDEEEIAPEEEVLDEEEIVPNEENLDDKIVFNENEDNDNVLNNMFSNDIYFQDGYIVLFAKGYYNDNNVPMIKDLKDNLTDDITLTIYNGDNELDLTNEEILNSELNNETKVLFTDSFDNNCEYLVIVYGDDNLDNIFDTEDIKELLNDYLEENNVPSMDVIASVDSKEEFGTVTFEDVAIFNGVLNNNQDDSDNSNLSLKLNSDKEEMYVGDEVSIDVTINSSDTNDFIDGLEASISSSNLELTDVIFNDNLIGLNKDGKVVTIGKSLSNEDIVMTLVFTASSEGVGTVSISGKVTKYVNIKDFDELTKEIKVLEKEKESSNAYLSSLNSDVGEFTPSFDKDVTEYTLTVPYGTESVILSGSLDETSSSVDGLIEYKLTGDETVAVITVTAEDGSIRIYTITIVRENKPEEKTSAVSTVSPITYYYSSNNYLKSLDINGYSIDFDKYTYEYKITVKSDVKSLEIKALPEDYNSRVEITGNEKFKKGENVVTITVTAEDGSTREYKILVNKEGEKIKALADSDESNNTVEKIVIIILIILVVLGLLYLIFKKDDEEDMGVNLAKEENKKVQSKKENTTNNKNKNQVKKKK